MLLHAYQSNPELGQFPKAMAKPGAKYKDGSHSITRKICYTPPSSLTSALLNALCTLTELFVLSLDFK